MDQTDPTEARPPVDLASVTPSDAVERLGVDEEKRAAAELEERLLKARKEVADAERLAESARAKTIREERKSRKSEDRRSIAKTLIGSKGFIPAVIIIVVLAVAGGLFSASLLANPGSTQIITSSTLERLVNISKLSTAEFVYNGIADKINDDGSTAYHVYYASSVRASIDMGEIDFDIDEEARTVTPILPNITIDDPVLDETSLQLMPRNPNSSLPELISLCKQDALTEVKSDGQIYATAQENLRSTIEALLNPLLEQSGYTLVWNDDAEPSEGETEPDSVSADSDNGTDAALEGADNE